MTGRHRVTLRPEHVAHVRGELRRALHEVRKVRVLERDEPRLRELLRRGDVLRRELVADPTRTRVQHRPDMVTLVEAHLDEVVTRTERSELLRDGARLLRVELGVRRTKVG